MMTLARLFVLIFMVCFSSLFLTSFVYSIRILVTNGSASLDIPLFLETLYWCAPVVAGLTLLAGTVMGDVVAGLFFSLRRRNLREEQKTASLIEHIQNLYGEKYGRSINPRILMMDVPHINGMALGKRTIAVSTGLLKTGTDDEIAGVIAHEFGHLHHRDGFYNLAFVIASFPTLFLNGLAKILMGFTKEDWGQGEEFTTTIILFVLCGLFMPYYLAFWLLSFLALWLMRVVEFCTLWPIEYRADRFVKGIGLAPALIELFERIEDEDIRNQEGFLSKYLYSHPPTALRIDQLERALLADAAVIQPSPIN